MNPNDNINICFVGGVSTGKSTGLNGVFCQKLTECKIKRTTMVPTIYVENENNTNPYIVTPSEDIYEQVSKRNAMIIEKTEKGQRTTVEDYEELVFNVGKLDINIMEDSFVNIIDMPGLNDARTKSVYYDYLETNFHKFNLIIFFVDIHSGLNTSDEIDIVNFITANTALQKDTNNREIYTLVVVNKADDMQLDETTGTINLTGELKEMYDQVEHTIQDEFSKRNIIKNLIGIVPLCAIDAYLYRMVRKYGRDFKLSPEQILKIGVNENGKKFSTLKPAVQEQKVYEILNDTNFIETMIKLSGFGEFERILHNFFKNGNVGKKIRIDNLLYKLRKLPSIDVCKSDGNYLTCDSINQLAHLVQNYMDVYIRIKSIDVTMFETQILSFVNSIEIYMMDEIKYIRELSFAITYYDKIVATILKPHFAKYYDTTNYSVFIKEHVNQIIKQMFSSDVKDLDIIICLDMLQKVGNFTKQNVSELFLHLIANPRAENTIQFEDKNDQNLIRVLSDCAQNGIMISNVLRFILINKINTGAYLYTRYLIYKKMGEITLSGYIYICMPRPSIDMVVRGCQDSDMSDPQFALDLFYLNYERKNG
jgi:GTP-binding protein EngB required for normal cell division